MPSEPVSGRVSLAERVQPADLPEWMDEPCRYEDFRACLRSLGQLNRLSLAYRPTLDFLESVLRAFPAHGDDKTVVMNGRPGLSSPQHALRIVDVGSGGGDMLRRIERWARRRGVAVVLVGLDLNPYAARAAREHTGGDITWITGDAFCYDEPFDVAISSLFTHHLADAEIVAFLAWMETHAQVGWFVNDLARAETPYRWIGRIARGLRWHRFVQHDGPVSFRRAFREGDWERLLAAAGVRDATLRRWTPARLCVSRLKHVTGQR